MIDTLGTKGVRVAQVTRSAFVDFWDNVAGSSLLGMGRYSKHARSTNVLLDEITGDFVTGLGREYGPVALGNLLKATATQTDDVLRGVGRRLYKHVDEIAPGPTVNLGPAAAKAKEFMRDFPEGHVARGFLKEIVDRAEQTVTDVITTPAELGMDLTLIFGTSKEVSRKAANTVSFTEANDLASWAYTWKTPGATAGSDQAVRVGRVVSKTIKNSIDSGGAALSPEGLAALKTAKTFWGTEAKTFNSRLVRKLLNDPNLPPEAIVNTFLKRQHVTSIEMFKKMVGGADGLEWSAVRRAFVDDIFTKAQEMTSEGVRHLKGTALERAVTGWGDDTLKAILGPAQTKRLHDLAEIVLGAQMPVGGGGGVMVQLQQSGPIIQVAGAIAGASGAVDPVAASGIILGPWAIAHIFTNEPATKMLLTGLRAPKGSATAVKAATRLSAYLGYRNSVPGLSRSDKPPSSPSALEKIFFIEGERGGA